jgi:membrane-associated phospholipid phosphatase
VRASEVVAASYAAYIACAAALRASPRPRRIVAWACSAGILAPAILLTAAPATPLTQLVRDWAPAVYILLGYYAAGALFDGPSPAFEDWLCRCDRWLLRGRRPDRIARWARTVLEIFYGTTFVMIPAGFAVLAAGGHRAQADRYWTIVSLAELGAFGVLPWLPSRPPWILDGAEASYQEYGLRRLALIWVRRTSHCANTFPSGHTAGSLAIALAVLPVMPTAGLVLLAIALGIAMGCVTGRYHYAIDVLTGVALALLAWAVVDFGFGRHPLT